MPVVLGFVLSFANDLSTPPPPAPSDPSGALQSMLSAASRTGGFGIIYLVITIMSWVLWIAVYRQVAAGTPVVWTRLLQDAPWWRCIATWVAFLLIPATCLFGIVGVWLCSAMLIGIASILGKWMMGIVAVVLVAGWLAATAWAGGFALLLGAVLILTEKTGIEALKTAFDRARHHALSLIRLTSTLAAGCVVFAAAVFALFLLLHPQLSADGKALWHSQHMAEFQQFSLSLLGSLSSPTARTLQLVLWPITSAYIGSVFIAWFAGTEAAPP